MLVLSRKLGEVLYIGKDTSVKVLKIEVGRARLGITAPAGVRVLREEVLNRLERRNERDPWDREPLKEREPGKYEKVGNNALRYDDESAGGFAHVVLYDADDYDTIVVNEDDIVALYERLGETIRRYNLAGSREGD